MAAAEFEVYEILRPALQWDRTGANLSLIWSAPGFRLETSTDLKVWSSVEDAESPYAVATDAPDRSYRLVW